MMRFFRKGILCGVVLVSFLFVNSCAKKVVGPELLVIKLSMLPSSPGDGTQMHFTDVHHGLMRGYSNIYKTNDGGLSWHAVTMPAITGTIVDIDFPNRDTAYFICQAYNSPNYRTVYRSIDGGETWTSQFAMGRNFVADFYTGRFGYGFGEQPPSSVYNFFLSNNAATTWFVAAGAIPAAHPENIQFINSSIGIAQGDYNFYNTFNGGATWNFTGDVQPGYYSEIFEGGIIFRVNTARDILKSTDYGTTWHTVFENTQNVYITDIDFLPGGFCCAIYYDKLLVSRDGGETWKATFIDSNSGDSVLENFEIGNLHIIDEHTVICTGRNSNYGVMVKIEIE